MKSDVKGMFVSFFFLPSSLSPVCLRVVVFNTLTSVSCHCKLTSKTLLHAIKVSSMKNAKCISKKKRKEEQ